MSRSTVSNTIVHDITSLFALYFVIELVDAINVGVVLNT
jgi:hypothetical protein